MAVEDELQYGTSSRSSQRQLIELLYPHKNDFELTQQLGEYGPRVIMPLTVLDFIMGKYKSKMLLNIHTNYARNKVGLDRKGRIEATELVGAIRRMELEHQDGQGGGGP